MKINILLFASLKERIGKPVVSIDIGDSATVKNMLEVLFLQYPSLQPIAKNILISVNQEFADHSQKIKAGDEVALFPPVSGG